MVSGFFAGGIADSLQEQQQNKIRQQALGLQQQMMQNEQERFKQNLVMKTYQDSFAHINQVMDAASLVDPENGRKQAAQGFAKTVDSLKDMFRRAGMPTDPIDVAWIAATSAPPKGKEIAAEAAAKEPPEQAGFRRAQTEKLKAEIDALKREQELLGGDTTTQPAAPSLPSNPEGRLGQRFSAVQDAITSGTFDPQGKNTTGFQGEPGQGAVEPQAAADAWLSSKKIGDLHKENVKGLADYRVNPNQFSIRKGPSGMSEREIMTGLAQQYAAKRGQTYDATQFSSKNRAMQSLGTRAANLTIAAQEFNQVLPVLEKAVAAVPNMGNFTDWNKLEQWIQQHSGQPEVAALRQAINSTINVYSRVISPIGQPTINDKEHARDSIAMEFSKGQFAGVFRVMRAELKAAQESLPAARDEILGLYTTSKKKPESDDPLGLFK